MTSTNVLLNSPEKAISFVKTLCKFNCEFDLESGRSCVDGKSIIGVMSLGCKEALKLSIYSEGELADQVMESIQKFVVA
ncbi:MAG: HPr family phosphocarrier protein [Lachnospiraceae bacterium]